MIQRNGILMHFPNQFNHSPMLSSIGMTYPELNRLNPKQRRALDYGLPLIRMNMSKKFLKKKDQFSYQLERVRKILRTLRSLLINFKVLSRQLYGMLTQRSRKNQPNINLKSRNSLKHSFTEMVTSTKKKTKKESQQNLSLSLK